MPEITRLQKPRYTGVPDVVFDKLLPLLEDSELRVLLVVIRKTLGWRQTEEDLSLNTIADLAGLSKSTVARATTSLIERELIERSQNLGADNEGQIASTYRVLLFDDNYTPPVPPMGQGPVSPVGHPPVPPMGQVIGRDLNTKTTDITTRNEITDTKLIDFETALHSWSRHRGFKKPPKPIRDRAREKFESVRMSQHAFDVALDGYYSSDWAKEQGYPALPFFHNPERWMLEDAGPPLRIEKVVAGPSPSENAPAPAVDAVVTRDFLAEWNKKAPLAHTEFDGGRIANSNLVLARMQMEFEEKFDEVCSIAQAIRQRDPAATWLDFYWILKMKDGSLKPGWKRLLTDMRGQSMERKKNTKQDQAQSALDEAREEIRLRIAKRKAAKDAEV